MIYLRALDPDAWMDVMSGERDALDSDVISNLSTTNHELSVWEVEDDLNNLEDVILAMAMTRNQVRELPIVKLNPETMRQHKLFAATPSIQEQEGDTGYLKMKNNHKNFMISSFWEMGYLAEYIKHCITEDNENSFLQFNSSDIIKILDRKLSDGSIEETSFQKEKSSKWLKARRELKNDRG